MLYPTAVEAIRAVQANPASSRATFIVYETGARVGGGAWKDGFMIATVAEFVYDIAPTSAMTVYVLECGQVFKDGEEIEVLTRAA